MQLPWCSLLIYFCTHLLSIAFPKHAMLKKLKPSINHQSTCESCRGTDFKPVFRKSALEYFIFSLKSYLLSPTAAPYIHHACALLCSFTSVTCLFSVLKSLSSSLFPGLEESPCLLIILAFVFSPAHKGPLHFLNVHTAWNISH